MRTDLEHVISDCPALAQAINASADFARCVETTPDLARTIAANPGLAQALITHADLPALFAGSPALVRSVVQHPEMADAITANSSLAAALVPAFQRGTQQLMSFTNRADLISFDTIPDNLKSHPHLIVFDLSGNGFGKYVPDWSLDKNNQPIESLHRIYTTYQVVNHPLRFTSFMLLPVIWLDQMTPLSVLTGSDGALIQKIDEVLAGVTGHGWAVGEPQGSTGGMAEAQPARKFIPA